MTKNFLIGFWFLSLFIPACVTPSVSEKKTTSLQTHLAQALSNSGAKEITPKPTKNSSLSETAGNTDISSSPIPPQSSDLTRAQKEAVYNLFLKGLLLEEAGKYDDACNLYGKALELIPHSAVLGTVTADALLHAGKPEEAIQTAEAVLKENSTDTDALKVIGQAYIVRQEWNQAIETFEQIRRLDPHSLDVLSELSNLYIRVQRYDDTLRLLREMVSQFPDQAIFFRLQIAVVLYQLNRLEEALKEYIEIAGDFPTYSEVQERIGAILDSLGRADEAIQAYQKALQMIRTPKEEITVRHRLGDLYREKQAYDDAFTQYNRIKELDPKDREAARYRALLQLEQKKYPEAFEEVNSLAKESPTDFRVQQLKLEILKKLNRSKEGFQDYLSAFAKTIQSGNKEEVSLFIWDLSQDDTLDQIYEFGQMDRYQQLLDQTGEKSAKTPRFYFAQAALTQYLKNPNGLQDRLRSILALLKQAEEKGNQKSLEAICREFRMWYRIRNAFFQQGMHTELLALLEKNRRAFPQNVDLIRTQGLVYMECRDWFAAETAFKESMSLLEKDSPDYKDILFQLATVYDKMNRLADIEQLMNEAIQKYPEDSEAYNFLGYSYADRNIHLEEALSLIEKSLKLNPDDGNVLDSLGWIYFRLGRPKEAVVHLEKALELEKNHPVILDHLGDVYAAEGQLASAVQKWKQALEFGPRQPFEFTQEFQSRIDHKIRESEEKLKP